ncbi:phage portal protein [Staphylococcus epidermidis]|nr:phage portal protein [Staphylococcus epidermidis]
MVSGAIASLPISIYERGSREKVDHDYWWLLNERAGEQWSAFTFWVHIQLQAVRGRRICEIVRSSVRSSKVVALKPPPAECGAFQKGDRVLYRVNPTDGGRPIRWIAPTCCISPAWGLTACSPSPITFAGREAIGAAIAAQDHSNRFFASGANFDYALKTSGRLNDKQLNELKASLLARIQNGGRGPLILSGGRPRSCPSTTRMPRSWPHGFSTWRISRILGVPPHDRPHRQTDQLWHGHRAAGHWLCALRWAPPVADQPGAELQVLASALSGVHRACARGPGAR